MLASRISGLSANFFCSHSIVARRSRPYIQSIRPSAHRFRERRASFADRPKSFTASSVSRVTSSFTSWKGASVSSSRGFVS